MSANKALEAYQQAFSIPPEALQSITNTGAWMLVGFCGLVILSIIAIKCHWHQDWVLGAFTGCLMLLVTGLASLAIGLSGIQQFEITFQDKYKALEEIMLLPEQNVLAYRLPDSKTSITLVGTKAKQEVAILGEQIALPVDAIVVSLSENEVDVISKYWEITSRKL